MKDSLYLIASFFILASIIACLGGLYELVKKKKKFSIEGLLYALGISSAFVWILILSGIGSWGISWMYMAGLNVLNWISEKTKVPFFLIFISPIVFLFLVGMVMKILRRKKVFDDSKRFVP